MKKDKKGMTREEAQELYGDLRKAMSTLMARNAPGGDKKQAMAEKYRAYIKENLASEESATTPTKTAPVHGPDRGVMAAVCFVLLCGAMKVALSVFEVTGVISVKDAQASLVSQSSTAFSKSSPRTPFSQEEVLVLTSLDQRRHELEERSGRLDDREQDLERRDKELVVKFAELRDLTERLHSERSANDQKKNTQLDQLANVYGSMNPPEAAKLIEQLDVTTALSLMKRMPEKRIGQILSLMSPERALAITRLLSGVVK